MLFVKFWRSVENHGHDFSIIILSVVQWIENDHARKRVTLNNSNSLVLFFFSLFRLGNWTGIDIVAAKRERESECPKNG